MKTFFLILISFSVLAQKVDERETTVLKIDVTEREKIERWTVEHTFPNVIVFIKDSIGNYIVGQEVLIDPAYKKLGVFDGKKTESLKDYLDQKTDTITYRPDTSKEDDVGGTKPRETNPK